MTQGDWDSTAIGWEAAPDPGSAGESAGETADESADEGDGEPPGDAAATTGNHDNAAATIDAATTDVTSAAARPAAFTGGRPTGPTARPAPP